MSVNDGCLTACWVRVVLKRSLKLIEGLGVLAGCKAWQVLARRSRNLSVEPGTAPRGSFESGAGVRHEHEESHFFVAWILNGSVG